MSGFKKFGIPLLLFIIVLIMVLLCWWWVPCKIGALWLWRWLMILLVLFCVFAGRAITGYWHGLLVDSRNMMSLSQFQLVMWTILLLTALVVAALFNICLNTPDLDPLKIAMQEQLWALIGISGASLAGSSLIQTAKKSQKENPAETANYKKMVGDVAPVRKVTAVGEVTDTRTEVKGVLVTNKDAVDASFLDMFRGEESGNGAFLDIGKIQMFFFTLLIWYAYAMEVGRVLHNAYINSAPITEMPELSTGMIALLGISHAAYLGNKLVPHTPDPPAQS